MVRILYNSTRSLRDATSSDIRRIDFSFTDIYVNEVYPFGYECRLNCKSTRTYVIIRSKKPSEIVGFVENIYQNTGKIVKPLNFIVDD